MSSTQKKQTHHFTLEEFFNLVGKAREEEKVGVSPDSPIPSINENCRTPQDLMLFCIMEMLKQLLFMNAKNEEDAREYAIWDSMFEAALNQIQDYNDKGENFDNGLEEWTDLDEIKALLKKRPKASKKKHVITQTFNLAES